MITLRDILKLNFTITLIELDVRQPDGKLIEQVTIGKDYRPTNYQLNDKYFNYIDADINRRGRVGRNGMSEMAYDVDLKAIPKKYLDMEVDSIDSLRERYGRTDGSQLRATVIPIQMEIGLNG